MRTVESKKGTSYKKGNKLKHTKGSGKAASDDVCCGKNAYFTIVPRML